MPIIDSVRKEVARSTILMNILQKGRRKEIGRKFGYVITPSMDKDLVRERVVNQVPYSEYFLFNFPVCSAEERKRFVSDIQRMEYINVMNTNKANEQIFCNKFKTYNYFKSFFKREILELNRKTTSVDAVIDFFTRHRTCIFKPINASFGRGIAKVRFSPSASKKEVVSWYEDMMHKYPMGGGVGRIHCPNHGFI